MIGEVFFNSLAPYSFLDGYKYSEWVKTYEIWISYEINDLLLVA